MAFIGDEIFDFSVPAFQNPEIKTITKQDVLGKWSIFLFYPADFSLVCPTELVAAHGDHVCPANWKPGDGGLKRK